MASRENRLARESSPYLLQHAHNPVDWYPWGEEALTRARERDIPILLSIGYAACHWCHVMERESFEDAATAAVMNRHFVCIKVDREERPDLDEIYMAATLAMSGQGGWPMTVFLMPDQRPFFAGTYFPPQDMHGRPGFRTLLTRLAAAWEHDREGVKDQAARLTEAVRTQVSYTCPKPVAPEQLEAAARQLEAQFDPRWGGFGTAPKFPPCAALQLLMLHHARSGSERSLEMVRTTLDGMHAGGMFDHVGGGFARYSTDERWHVPHFEKMLYDNGQLARVYTEAFQLTHDARYREVATQTLDYLLAEMQSESGAFFSATDADSEGVEGKFFTFTPAEVREAVGPQDAPLVCAYYDVREAGNWEGTNVLWTPRSAAEVAAELQLDEAELMQRLEGARARLYAARQRRPKPLLDDKVLVSWNALAIGALAVAARVFEEPRYLTAARRAAQDLWTRLRDARGRLLRTARGDRAHLAAYLEDYAFLGDALVDLYEVSGEHAWLERSRELSEVVLQHFESEHGAFHQTADDHERLLARAVDGQDGALPNANAVCGRWLLRLGAHLDLPELRERAGRALQAFGALVERAPRAFASTLVALDRLHNPPLELAVVGPEGEPREALLRHLYARYLPNKIVAMGTGAETPHPLLAGKTAVEERPALYICRNFACQTPIADPSQVPAALAGTI